MFGGRTVMSSAVWLLRRPRLSQTALVWLGLMAYVGLAAAVMSAFLPAAIKDPEQRSFFTLPSIIVITLFGLMGAWCSVRCGIPDALDRQVSNRQRWVIPTAVGLTTGSILVAYDLATHFAKSNALHFGLASQYSGLLPMALSFSAASVIAVGVIDLLPVPAATYLVSTLLLRGRGQAITFWIAAGLMSLAEPASQDAWALQAGQTTFIPVFVVQYVGNVAEFFFFRRAGIVAAVVFRLSVYVVWHVLYPH